MFKLKMFKEEINEMYFIKIIIIVLLFFMVTAKEQFKIKDPYNQKTIYGNRSASKNRKKIYWFHKPSCPHCVKMEDNWNNLVKLYRKDYDFVSVDTSRENPESIFIPYVNGVPTILLINGSLNKSSKIHKYNGSRTTEDMLKWIQSV